MSDELVEIIVRRPANGICWELIRPSNQRMLASPNLDLVAREAMFEVRKAGGRAVVVYDDQNSLRDRVARKRE